MGDLKPWDIAPTDTVRSYAAFAQYRDMGPGRSLEQLGRDLGKTKAAMEQLSVKYGWAERVRAFDEAAAKLAAERSLEDHAAVNRRHAELGRVLQTRGAQRLAKLPPESLSGSEAVNAVKVGAQIERDALGMAQRHELSGPGGSPVAVRTEIIFAYDDGAPDVTDDDTDAGNVTG